MSNIDISLKEYSDFNLNFVINSDLLMNDLHESLVIRKDEIAYLYDENWYALSSLYSRYTYLGFDQLSIFRKRNPEKYYSKYNIYLNDPNLIPVPVYPTFNIYNYYNLLALYKRFIRDKLFICRNSLLITFFNHKDIQNGIYNAPIEICDIINDYHKNVNYHNVFIPNFEIKQKINIYNYLSTVKLNNKIIAIEKLFEILDLERSKKMDIILIDMFFKQKSYLINQQLQINDFVKLIIFSILSQNKGGVLLIQTYVASLPIYHELLYLISNLYKNVQLYKSDMHLKSYRINIIATNFLGIRNPEIIFNLLFKIFGMGSNLLDKPKKVTIKDQTEEYYQDKFIHKLFDWEIKMPDEWINKINNFFSDVIKIKTKEINDVKSLLIWWNTHSKEDQDNFKNKMTKRNIDFAINWCKENNIEINPYYKTKEYQITSVPDYILQQFPPKKDIDMTKLQYTDESLTKHTSYKEATQVSKLILSFLNNPDKLELTEINPNLGESTIGFTEIFKKVNAIEISPVHCNILESNLKVYKVDKKVQVYCQNYLKIMSTLEQDIIYIRPDWGTSKNKIKIKINNRKLEYIINDLFTKANLIFVKLPINYDYDYFFETVIFKKSNIKIEKYPDYFIVILYHPELTDYS